MQKKQKSSKIKTLKKKYLYNFIKLYQKGNVMRDKNILLSFKREIDMKQKVIKSKKVYSRKIKHKKVFL